MAIDKNGVSVPAQSKDLDTTRVTTTYGLVHRQVISIADPESPTAYAKLTGTSLNVNVSNASIAVSAASLPLPTGAATSALQTTGNTSLSTIITNTTGVSTAANQTTGNASLSTIATNTTGLNSLTKNTGIVDANTIRVSPATDVTQAISAVSLPLPTGAATSALQTTGNNTLSNIDTKLGGTLSVNVGLTDAQLRASAVPISFTRLASGTDSVTIVPSGTQAVSGTVSATQSGTWNVNNISGTVSLPTGAATESTLVALSAKVVNGYSFHRSASNATTTIKSGAGVLKRVTVNTLGSALNTCTIYDNTAGSGTIIAVIDPTLARGTFEYDLVFNTGLTIVTHTGIAADLTIVYQ